MKEEKILMWVVVSVLYDKERKEYARSDYCVSEWGAKEKMKFFQENVDTLKIIKIYSLNSYGELKLVEEWNPERRVLPFEKMTLKDKKFAVPVGGIVFVLTEDTKTTGWYKKDIKGSRSIYVIENNCDKENNSITASQLEKNTKNDVLPKITYIADIDDEGKLFNSFEELTIKF